MKNYLFNLLQTYKELGVDFLIPHFFSAQRQIVADQQTNIKDSLQPQFENDYAQDEKDLKLLQQEVENCKSCELYRSKTHYVFGEGKIYPDLMFIGEAPGKTEDQTGRPFVGEAGQLLEKLIIKIGYKREDVYIANIVKCRPPGNRTPTAIEAKTCLGHLQKQIAIIKPKVIVTLGNVALNYLLNTHLQITKARGRVYEYQCSGLKNPLAKKTIPVVSTYHPAFLVREKRKDELLKLKWQMLSDVQLALQELKKLCR